MRKPTAPQLTLLLEAHRNGGRLPSQSFAYYGRYAPYGGTENIQAALAGAAKIRDDAAAERYLCDTLDRGQMLMAGGFLGVKREVRDGHGDLAERYVKAIRAGRIESGKVTHHERNGAGTMRIGYISTRTLDACIAAGWLTDRWEITESGLAAGRAATDPRRFAPNYELDWRTDCYQRAVQLNAGAPSMTRAAKALIDEDHAEALRINHALYGLPGDPDPAADYDGFRMGTTGSGKTNLAAEILAGRGFGDCPTIEVSVEEARDALAGATQAKARTLLTTLMAARPDDRLIIMDPKQPTMQRAFLGEVAGAMAGYDPDQLNSLERAAVGRGVPLATFRRLYPAVTRIADGDSLLRQLLIARDALVRNLTEEGMEPAVHTVLGDPREAGYRVALFRLRTNKNLPERIRRGAFYLELALSSAAKGCPNAAKTTAGKAAVVLV